MPCKQLANSCARTQVYDISKSLTFDQIPSWFVVAFLSIHTRTQPFCVEVGSLYGYDSRIAFVSIGEIRASCNSLDITIYYVECMAADGWCFVHQFHKPTLFRLLTPSISLVASWHDPSPPPSSCCRWPTGCLLCAKTRTTRTSHWHCVATKSTVRACLLYLSAKL